MKQTVYVVEGNPNFLAMFEKRGWKVVDNIKDAGLIQFTGGADVSPELYRQERHTKTYANPKRDEKEAEIFHDALARNIPMAGICRGGQFLNVMCGGGLYQDVDGHTNGPHLAFDLVAELEFIVTSTHHQMMMPGDGAKILLIAWESSFRERMSPSSPGTVIRCDTDEYHPDIEALAYPKNRVLCYQPHPEYNVAQKPCVDRYFDYLSFYCS